ncbi:MAG: hypothetical protein IT558_00120 [Alphaproteobacteria bacterium]|nr:hypothetical protein [Alphaproteobacteria bacterium]
MKNNGEKHQKVSVRSSSDIAKELHDAALTELEALLCASEIPSEAAQVSGDDIARLLERVNNKESPLAKELKNAISNPETALNVTPAEHATRILTNMRNFVDFNDVPPKIKAFWKQNPEAIYRSLADNKKPIIEAAVPSIALQQ